MKLEILFFPQIGKNKLDQFILLDIRRTGVKKSRFR